MFKYRKGVYSEHKSLPIASSEKSGPWAGIPISAMDSLTDTRVARWVPVVMSTATLFGAAGSGVNGWTWTALGAGTAASITISQAQIAVVSGTGSASGINLTYATPVDPHYAMVGAWPGGTFNGSMPVGSTAVFNFRTSFTQASSLFPTGAAAAMGYWVADTSLLTAAGASGLTNSGWGFLFTPGTVANTINVTAVSGTTGQNTTVIGTLAAPAASSTNASAIFNNYSIRVEKTGGSSNLASIQFFMNGILKTTHVSNLPAANVNTNLSLAAATPDGTNFSMVFDDISYAVTRLGFTA